MLKGLGWAICLCAMVVGAPAYAEMVTSARTAPEPTGNSWHPFIETEPLFLTMSGYAVYAGIRPPMAPKLRVGLGAMAATLPDFMVNTAPNAGWTLRTQGFGGLVTYHFGGVSSGFFAGSLFNYSQFDYSHSSLPGQIANVGYLSAAPYGGYMWFPMETGIYLAPWVGAGVALRISGQPTVGTNSYQEHAINPNFGLTLGYQL